MGNYAAGSSSQRCLADEAICVGSVGDLQICDNRKEGRDLFDDAEADARMSGYPILIASK